MNYALTLIIVVLAFMVAVEIFNHFNAEWKGAYAYLDKSGNPLGTSVHTSDVVVTIILDTLDGDLVQVHFDSSIDPHNWVAASKVSDKLRAVYTRDGEYVSGCHNYNVTKSAIDFLFSWQTW